MYIQRLLKKLINPKQCGKNLVFIKIITNNSLIKNLTAALNFTFLQNINNIRVFFQYFICLIETNLNIIQMRDSILAIFYLLGLVFSLKMHTCQVPCSESFNCIQSECLKTQNYNVASLESDLSEASQSKKLSWNQEDSLAFEKNPFNLLSKQNMRVSLPKTDDDQVTSIFREKQSQKQQNYLQKKYISYIGGPILFTAPHSKDLNRGGSKYGQKFSIHQRQLYTAWLAAKLAMLTSLSSNQPNSFMVWGNNSVIDEKDMDPNYLLEQMFAQSPFHQSLHYWAIENRQVPILHVDIHGKLNRKNCRVDVGIRPMQIHWKKDPLITFFKPFFQQHLSKMFEGLKFRNLTCSFNTKPFFDGHWKGSMMTMTEQAITLNIPSFQLQIPREVREALFEKPELVSKFAEGIKQFYLKIVAPYYEKNKKKVKVSKRISDRFDPTVKTLQQLKEAQKQILEMEQKLNKI